MIKKKMTLEKLAEKMESGFDNLEKKMMERFEGVGQQFISLREEIDERFDKVDERFDKVDSTMEHNRLELSSRLTSVEKRTAVLERR